MSDAVHVGLDPVGVPAAVGGFSQAAVVPAGCEVIFVSGQVPEALDGSVPEDFADQARLAWRNVERTDGSVMPSIRIIPYRKHL